MVRSAADAILEILKGDEHSKKDFDKKREIEDILGEQLPNDKLTDLMNLSKKINDWNAGDEDEQMDGRGDRAGAEELDEREGVAVVFDNEDEDEDEAAEFEVKDGDETDEEEVGNEDENMDDKPRDEEAESEDELVIGGVGEDGKHRRKQTADKYAVPVHDIDAFWLQRQISAEYPDPHLASSKTTAVFEILSVPGKSQRDVENELMEVFDYEHFELVKLLMMNQAKIVWCTRLARAGESSEERVAIESQMMKEGHRRILDELSGREADGGKEGKGKADLMEIDIPASAIPSAPKAEQKPSGLTGGLQPRKLIDLEGCVFEEGSHLMTNPSVKLPQGSTKRTFKDYEEIHVPAPRRKHDLNEPKLIPITDLPDWAKPPFSGSKELNRIQTRCFPSAFEGDGNLLICAPTGSGKTNVAMLTILREIGKHRDPVSGNIKLDDFKIVYIAPLKALVQEQVGNFGKRLAPYGIKVSELTGDRQLTKQQIVETQIIVTTPEKWDVITRKATDLSYTNLVRLIIIDEIHLLHDDRGPVLESIVSRTVRKMQATQEPIRLVGLSATLPNYRDVGNFLRVDMTTG